MAAKPDPKAEGKALAGILADARKGPMSFAMLEGAGGLVVQADRMKSVQAIRGAAKSLGGGRGCWGQMVFDGRTLVLTCEAEAPGGFQKLVQRHFSDRGCGTLRVDMRLAGQQADGKAAPKPDAERATGAPVKPEDGEAEPPADPKDADDADDIAAQAGDLKALIAATRKKPYNFACLLADDGVVLQAHRRKKPEILIKAARAAGGGPRGGFGTMRTEGKWVVLTCLEDPPRPLARALKVHLKARGFFLGVRLAGAGGDVLLEDGAEDEAAPMANGAAPPADGAAQDPAASAVAAQFAALTTAFRAAPGAAATPAAKKLDGMATLLRDTLAAGDMPKALKLMEFARGMVAGSGLPDVLAILAQVGTGGVAGAAQGTESATGKVIATVFNFGLLSDATLSVVAGVRLPESYPSGDEATAVARSLSGTAAVLIENGAYVVYQTHGTELPLVGEATTIGRVTSGGSDQTEYTAKVGNLFALITGDKYVVRIEGGTTRVDRDGSNTGPLDSHLQAFGPGLSNITDPEAFEQQMELAMRDMAHDMVNKAEAAATEAQARFSQPLSADDQALLTATLDKLAPIDKVIGEKLTRLRALYLKLTTAAVNPAGLFEELGKGVADVMLGTGTFQPPFQAELDEIKKLDKELSDLSSQRSAEAAEFPLALRIDDPDDFRKLSPADQAARLKSEAGEVLEDVHDTRENIDDGDFDFWTLPGIRNAAVEGLDLKEPQLSWAKEKADWEGTKDTIWGVGEAVVGVGLGIGATVASGGLALVLGGAALTVGAIGAINQTEEYFRKGSAANIALDPSKGMIAPEDVPHWGWVAAAWIGVGLDAKGVADAIKVMKGARTAEQLAEALEEAGRRLGVDPSVLRPALTGKGVSSFSTAMAGEAAFAEKFGETASEAVTVIRKNGKGGFDVEVVVRAGSDPTVRGVAVAEEMRHIQQLSDPKFAEDVALLSEGALADWATKSTGDKLKTLRAQVKLEEDARRTLITTLNEKLAKATGAERTVLQAELDEAVAGAEDFSRKLKDVDAGLASGKAPDWANLAHPPRLFNTPVTSKVTDEALEKLPGLRDAWDDIDAGKGYYIAKTDGGYQMKHRPGQNVPTRQLVKRGGKWEIEITGKRSVSEVRAEVEAMYGKVRAAPGMAEGMGDFAPYQKAYAKKFRDAFKALGDPKKATSILEDMGPMSDDLFEETLRKRLRAAMIEEIQAVKPAEQAKKLGEMMDALPDNGSRGALFSDFRKANMGGNLSDVTPGTNARKLAGQNRSGDGLVKVDPPKRPPGPKAKGPKPGNYLAEDKNSAAAFKESQLDTYNKALNSPEGLVMADGSKLDGVTYFFPDEQAARKVLEILGGPGYSPKIHVGFYENGKIVWAR